jgi:hypothetical protein
MHEPFYIRPAGYRYCLRSNPAYGWATGTTDDGLQVLQTGRDRLIFDGDGNLLRASEQELSFREGPIEVKRFWLPDRWMGVEDLEDPEESEMPPEDVEVWIRGGQFQFYPGWGDYIMGRRGNVEAS